MHTYIYSFYTAEVPYLDRVLPALVGSVGPPVGLLLNSCCVCLLLGLRLIHRLPPTIAAIVVVAVAVVMVVVAVGESDRVSECKKEKVCVWW